MGKEGQGRERQWEKTMKQNVSSVKKSVKLTISYPSNIQRKREGSTY
jgi:hypothetical protein